MPAKKTTLTDADRAKRMRALAREAETNNDPASFDRAFDKVVRLLKQPVKQTCTRNLLHKK